MSSSTEGKCVSRSQRTPEPFSTLQGAAPASTKRRDNTAAQLVTVKRRREPVEPIAPEILRVRNRKDDCFLIATINMLHAVPALVAATPPGSPLGQIFQRRHTDVSVLRPLLPAALHFGNADVIDALDALYKMMAEQQRRTFATRSHTTLQCTNGHSDTFPILAAASVRLIVPHQESVDFNGLFHQPTSQCGTCGAVVQSTVRLRVAPQQQALILCVDRARIVDGQLDCSRALLVPPLRHRFLGSERQFQLRTVMCYKGNEKGGHYVTYRQSGKKWVRISDHRVTVDQPDHRHSRALLYVREKSMPPPTPPSRVASATMPHLPPPATPTAPSLTTDTQTARPDA